MRSETSMMTLSACVAAAFGFATAIFIFSDFAEAAGGAKQQTATLEDHRPTPKKPPDSSVAPQSSVPQCSCPRERSNRPKFAGLTPGPLDETDELAALSSLHQALNSAGDGQAYIWQRNNGRLSGFVKPRATFRNGDRQICRHVEMMLTTGAKTERIESTACRQSGGQWKFEG
jgi:hypothetical protein